MERRRKKNLEKEITTCKVSIGSKRKMIKSSAEEFFNTIYQHNRKDISNSCSRIEINQAKWISQCGPLFSMQIENLQPAKQIEMRK